MTVPIQEALVISPSMFALALDPSLPEPVHRQIYNGLRLAVLDGQLRSGLRLPSSRALAAELGVSRNTVMAAFSQLLAEGYLEGKAGSGTYVAGSLPDDMLRAHAPATDGRPATPVRRGLSRRGAVIASTSVSPPRAPSFPRPFRIGLAAVDAFPLDLWARLVGRRWRRAPHELLGYGDPAGFPPLREAIAGHLRVARGVRCDAAQVIVASGSQQALDLAARLLLNEGDAVWMEEPGYLGARGALQAAGGRIVGVPVDEHGMCVDAGVASAPDAVMAYVTPSHQFPLGATMSLARRLALLEWASSADAWVLEDDYDSEYRYAGRPLAALQGLDPHGRVIYIGTFSKVMLPALRLGYVVVPPDLVDAFVSARAAADRHSPSIDQAALADFMLEGHFERHVRRMRTLYAERQRALLDACRAELGGLADVAPTDAGMHLVAWLPAGVNDASASAAAARHGIEAAPLSAYCMAPAERGALLLGYAAVPADEARAAVRKLGAALRGG